MAGMEWVAVTGLDFDVVFVLIPRDVAGLFGSLPSSGAERKFLRSAILALDDIVDEQTSPGAPPGEAERVCRR